MSDQSFLSWPFFEDRHRVLAAALEAWAGAHLPVDHGDVDAACRGLVAGLGAGGWLQHSGAGLGEKLDVNTKKRLHKVDEDGLLAGDGETALQQWHSTPIACCL